MSTKRLSLTLIALPFAISAAAASAQEPKPALPLKRVVLFSSGVGYFEHAAQVEDAPRLRLRFREEQISDVLKSLLVMDPAGAGAAKVSYPSRLPLERALQGFSVDLSDDPDLPTLLGELRGARVTVYAPEPLTGKILHVRAVERVHGDPPAKVRRHQLNLVTEDGLRSVPLDEAQRVTFEDPTLREELQKALSLIRSGRGNGARPMEIALAPGDARRVRAGYLLETAVWKSSYRLDLTPRKEQKPARLQGWAVFENTTEMDWEGVELSLVSGRPLSFRMDLYSPRFVERPELEPAGYANIAPKRYEKGMKSAQEDAAAAQRAQRAEASKEQAAQDAVRGMMRADAADGGGGAGAGLQAQAQAAAKGRRAGALFAFTVEHPVQLQRRESATLPFVAGDVAAEKRSIYNEQEHAKHPLHGARLTNDTGAALLPGPVTVYDEGVYAGDARIGHLEKGEKCLLSYAIDLGVTAQASASQQRRIASARIVGGALQLRHRRVYEKRYRFENQDEEARQLLIEHPAHDHRDLVQPEEPLERTDDLYRFALEVPAQAQKELLVREQRVTSERIALLDRDKETLLSYARKSAIEQDVRDALAKAASMKREIQKIEKKRERLRQEKEQIRRDQQRIRQNLASVGKDGQLGQRYVTKLSEQEDDLEALQEKLQQQTQRLEQRRQDLRDYVSDLNLGRGE